MLKRTLNNFLLHFLIGGLLLLLGQISFSQSTRNIQHHAFQGQIVRSYAVNPLNEKQILIGLKGNEAGTGKVCITNDGGISWTTLNKGEALCDSCEDVQAVCFIDEETFLAGTWKNGMYLSNNKGKKFVKIKNFLASDIRSIVRAPAGAVFAATTTHGIMKTEDNGKTWQAPHSTDMNKTLASWKLAIAPTANKILYAMTFGNGIYKTMDGGITWKQVLHKEDVMIWDIDFINNELYAVGSSETENFLFHSYLGEKKWNTYKLNMFGSINSLHIMKTFLDYKLLLGSWKNGVQTTFAIEYSNQGYRCTEIIRDDTIGVQDMYSSPTHIYNFSWGDGVKMIEREEECAILVPNSITPNSIGHTTSNGPIETSCNLDYLNFKLYDRWGKMIYQTKTNLDSVNFYFETEGTKLESESYLYWIKSSFEEDSDTVSLKGHISILN